MIIFLVVINLLLLAFMVKELIRLHSMSLLLSKDREVANTPNKKEEDFEFIKGLY